MTNELVVYAPICIAVNAEWKKLHKLVLREQAALQRLLNTVNIHYDRAARQHPELRQQLIDLRRDLMASERGVPRDEVPDTLIVQPALNVDEGTKYLVRRTWKKLAQVLHPDKGGDPALFTQAKIAAAMFDLQTLNHMYMEKVCYTDTTWRNTEGIAYLQKQRELVKARTAALMSTPQYKATQFSLQRQHEKAGEIAKRALQNEIANTFNRMWPAGFTL